MNAPAPDLSSILQTLSAYTSHPQLKNPPTVSQNEEADYDPSNFDPSLATALQSHHQQHNSANIHQSTTALASAGHWRQSSPASQPRVVDAPKPPPSTKNITTYAACLRHITSHLLPSPHFTPRIQHLIQTQHKHERQWHSGRETLIKQLQNRDASRKKLEEVLASIGGAGGGGSSKAIAASSSADATTGEMSKEEELKMYDRKVWRAQREMAEAAETELGKLGVPFFEGDAARRWEGKEERLRELRAETTKLLVDLCGADDAG